MPLFGREIEHATIAGRRDAPPKALRAQRRGAISRIRATISLINPGTSNKIPANMTWPPRLSAYNAVRLPWSKTTRMRVIMSTAEVAQDTRLVSEPASTRLNAQPKPTIAATAMNTASSRIG